EMYEKYVKPIMKEEYREVVHLPQAYIFDIDGTLAIRGNRGIHDYDKVSVDTPNDNIAHIERVLERAGYKIIVCSGRKDSCREETEKWLKKNFITYDVLLMRDKDDNRKDSIVKRELFEKNIRGKYFVMGCFDDRNQVVEMWRNMGLTCYQVADGNF
ncbi:MAG: phosphatase domain-containing protein, partial [Nitrospiria bacterium]